MAFDLRPYQTEMIDSVREQFRAGKRRVLVCAPTGSGKTVMVAQMVATAASRGHRAFFLVHRRELVKQSVQAFQRMGIAHGVVAADWMEAKGHKIQIASIQTIVRRMHRFPKPDFIIWDETHHLGAQSWRQIFKANEQAYHLGMTATPQRLDGTGLDQFYEHMVLGPSVTWLIENKWLSRYRLIVPPGINLAGLHTRMGDYISSELVAAVDKPSITGSAVAEYQKFLPGQRAIAFCVSVEHSRHVASQFNAAGIPAAHVDGETDPIERDRILKAFEAGQVHVLTNVELFGEGFDLPAVVGCIMLRPTQSLGLYLQQVGRALRPAPGKDCAIILDHAGNCQRHGLPDEERNWSLEGRELKLREEGGAGGVSIRVCPGKNEDGSSCLAALRTGTPICPYCKHVFGGDGREVEEKKGELVEVDPNEIRLQRLQTQGAAKSYEELVRLGYARKMRYPEKWATHIIKARQAKKLEQGRAA